MPKRLNPILDLQGHRGARGLMPENTLPAFDCALGIGVHTLELDCALTRDDVLVLSHDLCLNPDITRLNGEWFDGVGPAIRSLDYAALCAYQVGSIRPGTAYARRFALQQSIDDLHIPRLSDLFALVAQHGNESVRFNIETKIHPLRPEFNASPEAFTTALLEEIHAHGMQSRTSIQSFDWRTLAIVQREAPEMETVYLSVQQAGDDKIGTASNTGSPWTGTVQYKDFGSVPQMIHACGGRCWSPHQADLNEHKVEEAHGLGLKVIAWTVNEEREMEAMIQMGVDGIISDYPDRLRTVLTTHGLPLPPRSESKTALR